MISQQISDKEKYNTYTDKYEVEGYFNLKTSIDNIMYALFYSNISEFDGNLQGMIDERIYKTSIQNIHKLGWKAQLFKSDDVSMLGHGCGVSRYPQFYDRIKNIYQMLPHVYKGIYSVEEGHQFFQEPWILALAKSVETFVMVSISDMPTIKYWQNLGIFWILQKRRFLNNAGLAIHVLRHWQLLELIYSQEIQRILIM